MRRYRSIDDQKVLTEKMCDWIIEKNENGEKASISLACYSFGVSTASFSKWFHTYMEDISSEKYEKVQSIIDRNKIGKQKKPISVKKRFLTQVYQVCSKDEPNDKEVKEFCLQYDITLPELVICYKEYLDNYASPLEYKKAKDAHYLRQYDRVILSILKEESIEKKKELLMEHSQLYSLKAHIFKAKHPEYDFQMKQLTILFQEALTEKRQMMYNLFYKEKQNRKDK